MSGWREVTARVAEVCREGGLDVVHPFPREAQLGILIGNTRALWPALLAAADPEAKDPLDAHVTAVIARALAPFPHRVRYAHDPIPEFVPIQRIAEESGLARRSLSQLSIHPTYGPWIGLRAVATIEVEGLPPPAPPPVSPGCEGCELRCRAALDEALESGGWRRWLAVRDACNVGREWRYGEDQIAYHYTKDREVLRRAVVEVRRGARSSG